MKKLRILCLSILMLLASCNVLDIIPITTPWSTFTPGPTFTPWPTPTKYPTTTPVPSMLVIDVIDGDTIKLANGSTIRILGIDTPEIGDCGADIATEVVRNYVLGKVVRLMIDSLADDVDRYGRLLRYVEINKIDVGLKLVESGLADSYKYDSSTGYPYDREELYHKAQGSLYKCIPPTNMPTKIQVIPTQASASSHCSGRVFSNCAEMKAAGCAPAIRGVDDWYRSARDGDNDGVACE